MRLTTKGRYAVTAMLDIAIHDHAGPVALADISRRQGISLSYLEQLFARLRRHQLVTSTRGPGGGYTLSRAAADIPVGAVIEAVDEQVDVTRCGGHGDCQCDQPCLTHQLWLELSQQIRGFLQDMTLGDLMARHDIQHVAHRQDQQADHRAMSEPLLRV